LDAFEFVLADRLKMTVEELRQTVSNREFHQWRAFYAYRRSLEELEIAKAGIK
jgi:hypothetical protein